MIYSSNPLESSFILSNCAMEGVDKSVGSFVLSLGATINMGGVAIYLGATSVFMATCCRHRPYHRYGTNRHVCDR